jgi:L-threonylcarbamoyladenylate synthase
MVSLDDAAAALLAGEVVAMPTDTVYGIAVDPSRPGATDRLFAIKERPGDVAIPVLAADADQALALATDVPRVARALADAFWPGGLTIVLPRRPGLGFDLGGPDDATIGVRVPDHEVPRALARAVGPLATTSANLHGRPTPETAEAVAAELAGVAVVLDGGRCSGAPSTVVVCTGGELRVVREGRIGVHQLREVLS